MTLFESPSFTPLQKQLIDTPSKAIDVRLLMHGRVLKGTPELEPKVILSPRRSRSLTERTWTVPEQDEQKYLLVCLNGPIRIPYSVSQLKKNRNWIQTAVPLRSSLAEAILGLGIRGSFPPAPDQQSFFHSLIRVLVAVVVVVVVLLLMLLLLGHHHHYYWHHHQVFRFTSKRCSECSSWRPSIRALALLIYPHSTRNRKPRLVLLTRPEFSWREGANSKYERWFWWAWLQEPGKAEWKSILSSELGSVWASLVMLFWMVKSAFFVIFMGFVVKSD